MLTLWQPKQVLRLLRQNLDTDCSNPGEGLTHYTKSQKQFPFDDKVAKTALAVESSKAETLCPPSTSSASCAGAHTLTHSIRICLVMLSWAGCADVQGPYWPYTTSVFPPGPTRHEPQWLATSLVSQSSWLTPFNSARLRGT